MKLLTPSYRAHALFIEPAREKSQLWRLLLGIVLAAAIFLALSQFVFGTLIQILGPGSIELVFGADGIGQTAPGMILLLGQFGFLSVAAASVCIMVHKRRPMTLIGPPRLALAQFAAVSIGLLILLVALVILPPYGYGEPLKLNMSFGKWILLLPLSLMAVLVQISAEEIFFRGYVQQQLAARFRSPLIWIILPAGLFGIGHFFPQSSGSNAVTIAVWATAFGVLMADLTARAGTLGPAIAVHLFNNASAMILISTPDHMSGLALFVLPFGLEDETQMAAWLPVDFALMLVCWLTARLAIRA